MKKQVLIAFALLLLSAFTAITVNQAFPVASADAIVGKWLNEEKDGAVEIFKKGNNFYGKLVWLQKGPNTVDEKNPDATKRNRKLLGTEILQNFAFSGSQWNDGTIYDPKSGKTYSCKMWLNNDGSLSIRGYIGISLIGRTTVWTRPDKGHPATL
ncbi:DUF2147 domain-containing protein [Sphingobacteriales bacterium UPWRP_1]|nr:hypothetical protein B6N25_10570 [Sphingobacteriales bacterium TSM_CSS]PSJ79015.1 DUF2147 domain-containing protein [Sphingobacteriales bacterium UPWRP_1]